MKIPLTILCIFSMFSSNKAEKTVLSDFKEFNVEGLAPALAQLGEVDHKEVEKFLPILRIVGDRVELLAEVKIAQNEMVTKVPVWTGDLESFAKEYLKGNPEGERPIFHVIREQ